MDDIPGDNIGNMSGFVMTPPAILAAVGCFIFFISSIGVLGSYRENISLLRVYKYCLVTILLLGLCSGLVGFAFWPEVKKIVDQHIRIAIRDYLEDKHLRNIVDKMQRYLGCCGSLSIDDWDSNKYFICRKKGSYRSCGVPWSCCLPKHERNRQCGNRIRKDLHKRKGEPLSADIYTIGCLDKGFEYLKQNMLFIGGIAVASTVLCLSVFFCYIDSLSKSEDRLFYSKKRMTCIIGRIMLFSFRFLLRSGDGKNFTTVILLK